MREKRGLENMLTKYAAPFAQLLGGPAMSPTTLFQRLRGTGSHPQLTPSLLHVLPHYIKDMVSRLRSVCTDYSSILVYFPDSRADEAVRCLHAQCNVWEQCESSERWMATLFDGENDSLEPRLQTLETLDGEDQRLIAAWSDWLDHIEDESRHENVIIDSLAIRLKVARRAKKLASPAKRRLPDTDDAYPASEATTPEGTPIRDHD